MSSNADLYISGHLSPSRSAQRAGIHSLTLNNTRDTRSMTLEVLGMHVFTVLGKEVLRII